MSKEVTVYWAPENTWELPELGEWNMLYPEPVTLFSELTKLRTPDAGTRTYFSCPAAGDMMRNSYVFKNTIPSEYEYDFTGENRVVTPVLPTYMNWEIRRNPTITTGPLINFMMHWSFFAEEPLQASFTPPMLHKPGYTKYGTIIPGTFDIGQWFRPYTFEAQMWEQKGKFIINEDEPIFYTEFLTDKKVNLKRFKMNATLASYQEHCSTSGRLWGLGTPLEKRYQRFKESKMRELILKEIKNNLID